MLRTCYLFLFVALLIGISQVSIGNVVAPVMQTELVVADGPDPMPPPIPLAAPSIADGPDPMPPPIPLAVPDALSWQRAA